MKLTYNLQEKNYKFVQKISHLLKTRGLVLKKQSKLTQKIEQLQIIPKFKQLIAKKWSVKHKLKSTKSIQASKHSKNNLPLFKILTSQYHQKLYKLSMLLLIPRLTLRL